MTDRALIGVRVETEPSFVPGTPSVVFGAAAYAELPGRSFDISPDGERFLMIRDSVGGTDPTSSIRMVLVQNWFEELKARVSVD